MMRDNVMFYPSIVLLVAEAAAVVFLTAEWFKARKQAKAVLPLKHVESNGDRIRSMSDEELVYVVDNTTVCNARTIEECVETYGRNCEACILDWLKQGVE